MSGERSICVVTESAAERWLNGTRFHIVDLTLRVRQATKRGVCIRHSEGDGYFNHKSCGIGRWPPVFTGLDVSSK